MISTDEPQFLNLFIYSDSLAFRRREQPHDISFTYPFLLKSLVERNLGLRTNLVMRGGGGVRIEHIAQTLERDIGYFGGDERVRNVAILQFGIVDCAPRPFTYPLVPLLRHIPIIGSWVLSKLQKHRRGLQNLCSYPVTSKKTFQKKYEAIVYMCRSAHIRPLSVGLPLPMLAIEHRSPGFRRSTAIYNEVIRDVIPDSFCDIEKHLTESLREKVLLSDGHHLTEDGHQLYAEQLFEHLKKLI